MKPQNLKAGMSVIAPEGVSRNITPGKEYTVLAPHYFEGSNACVFDFMDDEGIRQVGVFGIPDSHLNKQNWKVKEFSLTEFLGNVYDKASEVIFGGEFQRL